MLLIFLSRIASSLFAGLFGSDRFFSFGTSLARGWRWPTGAGGTPPLLVTVEVFPPCAMAEGTPISTRSAIEMIVFFMLLLQFRTVLFDLAPRLQDCGG